MAGLTRSGARNASEIVILTLRTLQLSRFAMLSLLAVASVHQANDVHGRLSRSVLRDSRAYWTELSQLGPFGQNQLAAAS